MISKQKTPPWRFFRLLRNLNWTLLLVLSVMGIFGKRGWLDLRRMEKENTRLTEELSNLHQQKLNLTSQIHSLQRDKQTQEHTIRKVLGYIKSDEVVIEF